MDTETVKERIETIDRKHGPRASGGLNFGLFATYRHGSEIAHGSGYTPGSRGNSL